MADRDLLRVAVVARSVYPLHGVGGLERHVYDLVRHLLARDVRVTLITRPPVRQDAETSPEHALAHPHLATTFVPYRTFPFAGRRGTTVLDRSTAYVWFGYRAGRVAARMSARGKVDVVHGLGAAALGYALARQRSATAAAPFVFNPQGLEEFGAAGVSFAGSRLKQLAYWPLQRAVIACARAADLVLATDRALRPVVERRLSVGTDRIRVVPNAIDLQALDALVDPAAPARLRAHHGLDPAEPILLSVGRMERNKGFHVLAAALARLADRPWRWVLAGDGPFRGTLERLAAEHGLAGRVLFAGRVSEGDLHGWYETATVFVHPTLYEGSSLVTLEAMGHRRAVIGTMAGGLPDKIQPGVTGWIVPPGDVERLADAVENALGDPSRLAAMGASGRALVERAFSWPAVADTLLRVYGELLPGIAVPLTPDLPS